VNKALYALAIGNFAIASSAFTIAGVLNMLAADLHISVSAAGQLVTVYAVAYAVGSPFLMAASSRLSRRGVVLLGLALTFAGVLGSSLALNAPMLYASRVFVAFGAALYTPTAALIALTTGEPSRRIRGLSLVISGLTIAQIVGVPLGTYAGGLLGWRWGLALAAPAGAAALVMVARWVPRDIAFHPPSFAGFFGALRDWRLGLVIALT
jgi:predicted MFS family arabinose efflux permease